VTGLSNSFGVAVDATYIYWANYYDGTIGRALLDGTGTTNLVTGLSYPFGVAVDATYVYWSDYYDGTIGRATLALP
jgi:hypothetical protein